MSSGNESVVWDPLLDPGLAAGDVTTIYNVTSEHIEESLMCEPTLKLPAQLKELHVRVSHVQSPSSVYVQLTQNDAQLSRSALGFYPLKRSRKNILEFEGVICCSELMILAVLSECVRC